MRLIQQSGASGKQQKIRQSPKPGVGWFPQPGDAVVTIQDGIPTGGSHPLDPGRSWISAHVSNDQKRVWFALLFPVLESFIYVTPVDYVHWLGNVPDGQWSAKFRCVEGDTFHIFMPGDVTPLDVDVPITDTPWTDLGVYERFDGNVPGPGPSIYHLLCTVGHADLGSNENDVPFYMIPPPNTAWPAGRYPSRTWDAPDPSPVNWSGGFALAQSINATVPSDFDFLSLDPLNVNGVSFCPFEHAYGVSTDPGVEGVKGPGSVPPLDILTATFTGLPASVVAGVPFDFQVQINSPFDGGTGASGRTLGYFGISGFGAPSGGITNVPTVTDLGGGLYQVTGFAIYMAGLHQVKLASVTGFPLRSTDRVNVLPAAPVSFMRNISTPQFTVGDNTTAFVCGELLTGRSDNIAALELGVYSGKFKIQGIREGQSVTRLDGSVVGEVGAYAPITVALFDAYVNVCENDSSTQVTVSLTDLSGGVIPPHLSGTLTRTAVNGLVTFPDLRARGLGSFKLHFTSPGVTPLDSLVFKLQPLLDVSVGVGSDASHRTVVSIIVKLLDLAGAFLSVSSDSILLTAGPSGSDSYPLLGATAPIVDGEAAFTANLVAHGTFDFTVQSLGSVFPSVSHVTNKITV